MEINIKNQLVSRTAKILIYMLDFKESNITEISRDLKIDYAYTSFTLKNLDKMKLVNITLKGSRKIVWLTDDGVKIAKNFKEISKYI
ncbi:hypothetical protein KKG81_04685 [bacterium]|nr:hypothetical protein [bacterium]